MASRVRAPSAASGARDEESADTLRPPPAADAPVAKAPSPVIPPPELGARARPAESKGEAAPSISRSVSRSAAAPVKVANERRWLLALLAVLVALLALAALVAWWMSR
jgi:hypothetical protein